MGIIIFNSEALRVSDTIYDYIISSRMALINKYAIICRSSVPCGFYTQRGIVRPNRLEADKAVH
jgi:hypothetical protein